MVLEVGYIKTYGRKTIKVNYTEKDILDATPEKQEQIIIEILDKSMRIHEYNAQVSRYLRGYYKGIQDIQNKEKYTRTEINNKTVENWCYAFIDFKKCYLLGKPIQYVQLNDSGEKEISLLNKYVKSDSKKEKDMDIYEDVLVCGRGFRYTNFRPDKYDDDEIGEIPFEILNADYDNTEVIYSNRLGNEQLMAYIVTDMEYLNITIDPVSKQERTDAIPYKEVTVYTRGFSLVVSNKTGEWAVEENSRNTLTLNDHVITEYYANRDRISLIEIGKDLFDDINYLESNDKDDMTQFVNAIMVFVNASFDAEDLEDIKELGALSISSTEGRKAGVSLLQQRLNATDTQVYYTRLLTSLHQILGVPMSTDNGSVTSGDTGKAKLTGQGYTMAGIRCEGQETMFKKCDEICLRKILKICRESVNSEIKNLKISDVDSKFQRDMSENILTKTQALLNLYNADIPRKFANAIIGLFGDPNAITSEQETLFGKQVSQMGAKTEKEKQEMQNNNNFTDNRNTTNNNDITSQQENKIQNITERNEQGDS